MRAVGADGQVARVCTMHMLRVCQGERARLPVQQNQVGSGLLCIILPHGIHPLAVIGDGEERGVAYAPQSA